MSNIRWNLRVMSHARRKVTAEQVLEMRAAHALGESYAKIAKRYGLAHSTVADLCAGRKWRGVGMTWGGNTGADS